MELSAPIDIPERFLVIMSTKLLIDSEPTETNNSLNKLAFGKRLDKPANIFGMPVSSIVYMKLESSLNLIADVTIGPLVA